MILVQGLIYSRNDFVHKVSYDLIFITITIEDIPKPLLLLLNYTSI